MAARPGRQPVRLPPFHQAREIVLPRLWRDKAAGLREKTPLICVFFGAEKPHPIRFLAILSFWKCSLKAFLSYLTYKDPIG
jgi:hypothetical protein